MKIDFFLVNYCKFSKMNYQDLEEFMKSRGTVAHPFLKVQQAVMISAILVEFGYRVTLTTKKQKNVGKMLYVNTFLCLILVSYSHKMVVSQC